MKEDEVRSMVRDEIYKVRPARDESITLGKCACGGEVIAMVHDLYPHPAMPSGWTWGPPKCKKCGRAYAITMAPIERRKSERGE